MTTISTLSFVIIAIFGIAVSARYVDKDVASNGYNAKLFDYYDVAKGNIPTYLTEVDKPLEPFQEDSEPIKINGIVDNNLDQMMRQEHAIEVQPAENRPETLEGYDEYAEETVNKPLETPVAKDDDTKTVQENIPTSKNSTGIIPIFVPVTPTPAAAPTSEATNNNNENNENEPISNVEDVMILRTVKPLCSIHEPCD